MKIGKIGLFLIIFFLVPMAEAVDYADQFRQAMDDFTYQMDKKEHDQSRPQDYTLSEYQSNLDLKQSTPNNQDELYHSSQLDDACVFCPTTKTVIRLVRKALLDYQNQEGKTLEDQFLSMLIRSTKKMKYYLSGVKHTDDVWEGPQFPLGFRQVMSVEVPIPFARLSDHNQIWVHLYKNGVVAAKVIVSHFRPVMVDVYVLDPELYKSPKRIFEESHFGQKPRVLSTEFSMEKLFYYKGDDLEVTANSMVDPGRYQADIRWGWKKKDRGYFRLEGRHDGIEQKFHAFAGQKMLNYGFVYTVIDEKSAREKYEDRDVSFLGEPGRTLAFEVYMSF